MRNQAEFERLFEAEYDGLVRLAFLLCGNSTAAEEVTQEAFARAAARWQRIQHYDKPGAWLRLVVVRLAHRRRYKSSTEQPLNEADDWAVFDEPPPDPELRTALGKLAQRQRECVVLYYLQDLPVPEIASILKVPEGTVRSHLHRGRQALEKSLSAPSVSTTTHSDEVPT